MADKERKVASGKRESVSDLLGFNKKPVTPFGSDLSSLFDARAAHVSESTTSSQERSEA